MICSMKEFSAPPEHLEPLPTVFLTARHSMDDECYSYGIPVFRSSWVFRCASSDTFIIHSSTAEQKTGESKVHATMVFVSPDLTRCAMRYMVLGTELKKWMDVSKLSPVPQFIDGTPRFPARMLSGIVSALSQFWQRFRGVMQRG